MLVLYFQGHSTSIPISNYSRTAWCLNEKVVILRDLFVKRKPLTCVRSSPSICLFFSGGERSMEGQLRVMVLDTSPTARKILEVILRREGHQVVCFDDSLEAMRFLSQHGPADLLFLSVDLPKMDGFDVLKYLRGETRFRLMVLIAILSERDGVLGRVKARLAGAQHVVVKPLARQQIVALVSAYPCWSAPAQSAGNPRGSPGQ
jgi:twitching motility two-component system response regulator PilG